MEQTRSQTRCFSKQKAYIFFSRVETKAKEVFYPGKEERFGQEEVRQDTLKG